MRIIAILLVAGLLFAAGYWTADRIEDGRIWNEDRLIGKPSAPPSAPRRATVPDSADDGIRFVDIAAEMGMSFVFYDGAEGNFHLMETTGGGMAVLDFDADGNQDIFLVNGSRLPVDPADRRHVSKLYRNHGASGLEDVTGPAGVELIAYGQGATAGDYDNDGFDDLFVSCFGRCVLYHSNGDGTFFEIAAFAGVGSTLWCTSAAFSDLDQDGALDLYLCTYGEVSLEHPHTCERGGKRMHCLPTAYSAQSDLLFRNQGDGTFQESSRAAGIREENGRGLGVAIADFNDDGQPDIFVANDTSENFLFLNQTEFRFEESALSLGVALTGSGSTMSGMGVACGDYDLNGWPDLFVTNFYQERNVLYQNMGPNGFIDSADATGVGAFSRDRLGFGTVFLDADLDGFQDLFVANGHVSDMSSLGIPYKMRPQFLHNQGNGMFVDSSNSAGAYFHNPLLGRGVASADINNDGLPDLVVSHILDTAALLLNRTAKRGRWLGLELIGTRSNRNGLNAKIRLSVAGQERAYEIIAGGGYLSSSDKRLLIGLGQMATIDNLVVHWPSGMEQKVDSLLADRYHRLVEPVGDEKEGER